MGEHKFKAFLRSRNWNQKQSRTFVDNALTQQDLPDTELWEDLEAHLKKYDSPPDTIEEVKYIWELYMKKNSN